MSVQNLSPVDVKEAEMAEVSVVLAVRDRIMRYGIAAVLSSVPMVSSVRHCDTVEAARMALEGGEGEILIMFDFEIDTFPLETIGPALGRARVLMVLSDEEADTILESPVAPDGFVAQIDLTEATLTDAIRRLRDGEFIVPAGLGRRLLRKVPAGVPQGRLRGKLTTRQAEALALLAEGLSNKQIARRLGISPHGAKRIVASLLLKLDSPNRTAAVVSGIQLGLIEMPSEV